jgi:NAD(P)-dependent dehydrogenase (short-subunit alcohol dehydrogenase family)
MASVLITGGASGLGRAMAIHFAKKGYDIALHYFSSNEKEIIEQILSFGVKCKAYYADLTANDIDFFDQVANDFSDLSILINNASIFDKTKYLDMLVNNYEQCFNIHVKNPLFLSQKFAKICNGKIIINISDALAEKIDTKLFIHAFSKNAMLQMTKMLSKEFAPRIRVNAICPGYIYDKDENNATEDDVLAAIDYLILSKHITAEILHI